MHDQSSIKRINQVAKTRRIAIGIILLALLLPILYAWGDNDAVSSALAFTVRLVLVTVLAVFALRWAASHYSPGVQVQILLAFALVLIGWSGYTSRIAYEARALDKAQAGSSMPSQIPSQGKTLDPDPE